MIFLRSCQFWQSDLGLRILPSIVMIIAIISISYYGGFLFLFLSVILSCFLFYEWTMIVKQEEFDKNFFFSLSVFIIAMMLILLRFNDIAFLLLIFSVLFTIFINSSYERIRAIWLVGGAVYSSIPALTFCLIRGEMTRFEGGSFALLMFIYFSVWATDIFAYLSGRFFCGPKLLPILSPQKTWSGAIGGLWGALFVGFIFFIKIDGFHLRSIILFSAFLSVICQIGDLFVSWVKRCFSVKDSSHLIPGHGGVLDRADSLVAAVIPVAIFLVLNSP
ncbi:phosphatidate cytidylyltransferase [Candidatus Endowatersipora endosymbiont of Watersipora subatra]|uniref:phosphatidate cytidylyltransferase n=1 Tax=Candidatus Endowatersipora endosymbiont of Watersipora subatra TaxID=3077946 RepID=UPI00312C9735